MVVKTVIINRLCNILECKIEDIMEFVPDEKRNKIRGIQNAWFIIPSFIVLNIFYKYYFWNISLNHATYEKKQHHLEYSPLPHKAKEKACKKNLKNYWQTNNGTPISKSIRDNRRTFSKIQYSWLSTKHKRPATTIH